MKIRSPSDRFARAGFPPWLSSPKPPASSVLNHLLQLPLSVLCFELMFLAATSAATSVEPVFTLAEVAAVYDLVTFLTKAMIQVVLCIPVSTLWIVTIENGSSVGRDELLGNSRLRLRIECFDLDSGILEVGLHQIPATTTI
jgi:hypothetical protein